MEYHKWAQIDSQGVEIYGEERIYRDLIRELIDNIPLKELKQVFYMCRRPMPTFVTEAENLRSSVQVRYTYEVILDLPLNEQMIDLKDEINIQLYGTKDLPGDPRNYKL